MYKPTINNDEKIFDLYDVVYSEELGDFNSDGIILVHKKSGAHICIVSNSDENKTFMLGFRTPPSDNSGVAHIVEHSVLRGSKNYPNVQLFADLAKGTLNTFLNAMTFADRTVYSFASCNNEEFYHLMNVYMDSVFFPNIYLNQNAFLDEGCHIELDEIDGSFNYTGVVYNEMVGAFSSIERNLYNAVCEILFPDSPYGKESAGKPNSIPKLTYEQFVDFHRQYYQTSNCYIYIYGNMDINTTLKLLNDNYLKSFDKRDGDFRIVPQKELGNNIKIEKNYSFEESCKECEVVFFSWNAVISNSLDSELCIALEILEEVLMGHGAPLRQAIHEKSFGGDILTSFDYGIFQPVFSITVKNAQNKKKNIFFDTITNTLRSLVNNGLNKESILAAINRKEMYYRELDFGGYPRGIKIGLNVFCTWLYDSSKAFNYINIGEIINEFRNKIDKKYFESLIKKYLLNSKHSFCIVLAPDKIVDNNQLRNKNIMNKPKVSFREEELLSLVNKSKSTYNQEHDLFINDEFLYNNTVDIKNTRKKVMPIINEEFYVDGVPVVFHDVETNGIVYVKILFDIKKLPNDLVQYIALFEKIICSVDTQKYSVFDLNNCVRMYTGEFYTSIENYGVLSQMEEYKVFFGINFKCRYIDIVKILSIIIEMIFYSNINNEKKIIDIVRNVKNKIKMNIANRGQLFGVKRLSSYFSQQGCFEELTSGITFYEFLEKLEKNYEMEDKNLALELKRVVQYMFRKENMLFSVTAENESKRSFTKAIEKFLNDFKAEEKMQLMHSVKCEPMQFLPIKKNEGIIIPNSLQCVVRGGNLQVDDNAFFGHLKVLETILRYDYLWKIIRNNGGAYDCYCKFIMVNKTAYFVSFRDPRLKDTNDAFNGIYDFVNNFSASNEKMMRYIIGTLSEIDRPLSTKMIGGRSMGFYLTGINEITLQNERDNILKTTETDIRNCAEIIRRMLDSNYICVIGSEEKIKHNIGILEEIRYLDEVL